MSAVDKAAQKPRRRWVQMLPVALAFFVWAVDQSVKQWVLAVLPDRTAVPVLGDALQWFRVENPGAAFSLGINTTWIFTLLSVAVFALIVWFIPKLRSAFWALFFGLLLGGVTGNLTDRLFRQPSFGNGHVIDFISTPWMMPAIYNIADIAIVSSMCLMVLLTLLGFKIDGTREKRGASDTTETAG